MSLHPWFSAPLARTNSFDRLFDEVFRPPAAQPTRRLRVTEEDDRFVLSAEVPGRSRDQLKLTLTGQTLQVAAESPALPEGYKVLGRGRRREAWSQTLRFASPIDGEGLSATLEHGVLTITVPKQAAAQPRAITIS